MVNRIALCPACGASVSESARFCPKCGGSLTAACSRCGARVTAGASFCDSCGAPVAASVAGAEERKLATILFADITGSTSLGEQLDPERMRRLLQTYFDTMSSVIEGWGGRLEKFIGDAIMATFGVPTAREDDPERALRAALEMLARLDGLNAGFQERHGVAMQVRIGVNTGEVIAPVDPGDQMLVSGDAVNVAARLEQSAEPRTVVVGDRTYLATRGIFEFEPPIALTLKGKGEPVLAHRLVGLAPEPAPRGVPGLRGELIGRERELRTLLDILDGVIETELPHLVLLTGPAGIGKSRLVQEFIRVASDSHEGLVTLRGRCLPMGHGITYWALGEILRQFGRISLDEPADAVEQKLRSAVDGLVRDGQLPDDDRLHVVHALAMTAGLPILGNPLENLPPDAVAAELARAWPAFLSAIATIGPTVVVLEDVHWAGDQLMDMVDRLLSRSSGPLLLVATARPEFGERPRSLSGTREDASTVSLRPLTGQQSADLIESLLNAGELPAALRSEILAKAEGNPFFVEEMLRRLIDERVLVHDEDGWRTTGAVASVTLPDSVHALLAARIDALPLSEKRVLQEASVIGRIFWQAPVERAAGNGAVAPALLALEQKGLVLARPTTTIAGHTEYIFKHALIRDVAYASLPKARRARAHADVAEWIEQLAGARIDEFAELVAHHYQTAVASEDSDLAWENDPDGRNRVRSRAFQTLVAAGASARRRYAIAKAVEVHEAARDLAADPDERATALEELGDDHFGLYHCDEALSSYEEALALLTGEHRDRRVQLAEKIGHTCARWGAFREVPDPARIERIVARGLEEADSEEARARLQIVRAFGSVYWVDRDEPDPVPREQRLAWAREGLAAAERLDDPFLLTRAINALATMYYQAGKFRESLDVSLRLLDLVDRQPSRDAQAATLSAIGADMLTTTADVARATELTDRGYQLARGTSDHELMHSSGPFLRALFHVGRWSEIPPVIEAHLAAYANESQMTCPEVQFGPPFAARFFAETGDADGERATRVLLDDLLAEPSDGGGRRSTAFVANQLAQYALTAGRPDDALSLQQPMLSAARPAQLRDMAPAQIEILVTLGRWDELRDFVERVRPLIAATPLLSGFIDRAVARSLAAAGDHAAAIDLFETAISGFEALSCPFEAARTRELLADLPGAPRRRELLEEALDTYEVLGAEPHAAGVRAKLKNQREG